MILRIKNIPVVLFLFFSAIGFSQVPFEHVVIDENGPTSPWGKAIGDLNSDGFPDLIVGGWYGDLVWYAYPDWEKEVISEDRTETDISVEDIDGDDINDVLAIGLDGLQWYEAPSWDKHIIYPLKKVHDVETADLNLDGKMDIVARNQKYSVNSGDTIHLFIQGETVDNWSYFSVTCEKGEGLQIFDVNSDGKPDLLIGKIWFENTGDMENWTSHTYASSWDYPHTYIATGDFNSDGLTDIIISPAEPAGSSYKIAWYEQPEDVYGEWEEHIVVEEIETTCHFVGAADFDLDGKVDAAVAQMQQSTDPDEVFILLNQGDGNNWEKQVLATSGSHSMKIADIGLDGDFDLFGANWSNNTKVEMWLNLSDTITQNASVLDDWERHVIDVKDWTTLFIDGKDLNGDGLPEIITGGWWYANPGTADGDWGKNTIGTPLNNLACVYDFDDDGDFDILGTEGEGATGNANFVWARNDGNGNFTIFDNIDHAEGDFLQGVTIVRNENEYPYYVALSWHMVGQGVQTLKVPSNPSEETWTWEKISDVSQDEALSSGDIDKDGQTDILLGTKWLKSNSGGWLLDSLMHSEDEPDRNKLGDLNGDGNLDAIVGFQAISTVGKLAWYEFEDSGEWTENLVDSIVGPMSLDAVDMDNDGDMDIVVGEHNLAQSDSARMFVYENVNGDAKEWEQHLVYKGDEHHDGAVAVDIDNDGDMDILSIGWGHKNVLLYENRSIVSTVNGTGDYEETENKIKIYPNPAGEEVTIEFSNSEDDIVFIRIFNVNGSLVYQKNADVSGEIYSLSVQTQNWEPGMYIVQVVTPQKIFTEKCSVL